MRKQTINPFGIEAKVENAFQEDESYLSVKGLKGALKEYLGDVLGIGDEDCKTSSGIPPMKPCTLKDYETCKNYKGKIPICSYCPYRGNVGRNTK